MLATHDTADVTWITCKGGVWGMCTSSTALYFVNDAKATMTTFSLLHRVITASPYHDCDMRVTALRACCVSTDSTPFVVVDTVDVTGLVCWFCIHTEALHPLRACPGGETDGAVFGVKNPHTRCVPDSWSGCVTTTLVATQGLVVAVKIRQTKTLHVAVVGVFSRDVVDDTTTCEHIVRPHVRSVQRLRTSLEKYCTRVTVEGVEGVCFTAFENPCTIVAIRACERWTPVVNQLEARSARMWDVNTGRRLTHSMELSPFSPRRTIVAGDWLFVITKGEYINGEHTSDIVLYNRWMTQMVYFACHIYGDVTNVTYVPSAADWMFITAPVKVAPGVFRPYRPPVTDSSGVEVETA